jgi:hypothetical protein
VGALSACKEKENPKTAASAEDISRDISHDAPLIRALLRDAQTEEVKQFARGWLLRNNEGGGGAGVFRSAVEVEVTEEE